MSLYFADPTDSRRASPAYFQRGLFYRPLNTYPWPISAIIPANSTSFLLYREHLGHIFASAMAGDTGFIPIDHDLDITGLESFDRLPLRAPHLQIHTKDPISDEDLRKYKGVKVYMGPQNPHSYQFERATFTETIEIAKNFKVSTGNGPVKASNSSIDGLKAISTVSRLLCLYLGTQAPMSSSPTINKELKMGVVYILHQTGWEDRDATWEHKIWTIGKNKASGFVSGGDIAIEPMTHDTTDTIRSVSQIPRSASGHYFPYFEGSIDSQPHIVKDMISQYFYRVFGAREAAVAKGVSLVMGYWEGCAASDVGKELTHLAYVIKLGMETGGRVVMIHDGEFYRGAVLQTSKWLKVENSIVKPLSGSATTKAIESFVSAAGILTQIAALLSSLQLADGSAAVVLTEVEIRKSAQLVEQVMLREPITAENILDNLAPLVKRLVYDTEDYITVNSNNLISFLHGAKSGTTPDTPMAITIEALTIRDPAYFQLARFGHTAPSFINPGGVKFDLFKRADDDPNSKGVVQTVVKRMKGKGGVIEEKREEITVYGWGTIFITRKELQYAYADYKQMVREKAIRQTRNDKIKSTAMKVVLDKGSGPLLVALRDFGNDEKLKGPKAKKNDKKRKYEAEIDVGEDIEVDSDDEADVGVGF